MTDLIWSIVPGLNTTWLMPTLLSSSISSTASSSSGMPADTTTPSIGAPGLASPLHQPLSAHLQLPQVRVEEQRVELDGAAGFEHSGEFGDAALEDLLGDLAAARELGPVACVGGRGNDLGVDGRRGHACEQDR